MDESAFLGSLRTNLVNFEAIINLKRFGHSVNNLNFIRKELISVLC
jgi:hypothetical protein